MAFGYFVDIAQQDGTPVRMHYEGMSVDTQIIAQWMGVTEATAAKYQSQEEQNHAKP